MSDTPRTDEAQFGTGRVSVDFARQLERELNAANDKIKRLEELGDEMAIHAELGAVPLAFVGVVNAWREAKEAKL